MLTATTEAKEYLAHAMKSIPLDASKSECFRLEKKAKDKLALVAGQTASGDVTIEHEDATVLAVEPQLADQIGERTLSVKDDGQGQSSLYWK